MDHDDLRSTEPPAIPPRGGIEGGRTMAGPRRAGLLLAILGLSTCLAHGADSPHTWEAHNEAGWKAYEDGKLAEADKHLRAAMELAQPFAATDMRKATSYGRLAAL